MDESNIDLKISALVNQRVIVRIWTSGLNINKPGANVGHVSLQTPNKYMSLWPRQATIDQLSAKASEGKGVASSISHQLNSLERDIAYEGRKPEYLICLYTLDFDAVEEEYDTLTQKLEGWALLGGLICDDVESCASLAWKLLVAGGIKKLVTVSDESSISSSQSAKAASSTSSNSTYSTANISMFKSQHAKANIHHATGNSSYSSEMAASLVIKSPDAVAEFIKQAKLKELSCEPTTRSIIFTDETQISVTQTISERSCCMM